MKYFMILAFLAIKMSAFSNVYYADASSTSSIADGSLANPFKTLADVQNHLWFVAPGDTILFKRGEVFTGNLVLLSGGTSTNPILLGAYGNGPKPIFLYDLANGTSALDRWIIKIDNANYVYVENIEFDDITMDSTVHNEDANVGVAVFITQSDHCIVRNITVRNLGEGVILAGNHCLIENSNMSHLRMIVNTPESNGNYADDDFGAASVVITGSHNKIVNNHFEDNWGESYDYTFDGGGIEIYGSNSDSNEIMYNTVVECNGFTEVGGAETAWDNLYAYNLVINCTVIGAFHLNGLFGSDIQRMRIYNNVFIETKEHLTQPSHFLGIGALTSSNATDVLSLKNNIFFLKTAISVAPSNAGNTYGSRITHENNIYFMNGGALNYPIDTSELILDASTVLFTDTSNTNPLLWDYNLNCNSLAINFGQDVTLMNDYAGAAILSNTPNAGILEDNCATASTTNLELATTQMDVFPNPCSEILNIRNDNGLKKIYTLEGKIIITTEKNQINVSHLSEGIYVIKSNKENVMFIKH